MPKEETFFRKVEDNRIGDRCISGKYVKVWEFELALTEMDFVSISVKISKEVI